MQNRVDAILGKDADETPLRYMIYSAHDDQISNLVEWLHSTNIKQDYVLYASQVVFELRYDSDCVAGSDASEDCFTVSTIWNGEDMAFMECESTRHPLGTHCTLSQFK